MTMRRDFLAFSVGAIAARTVLPIAAKAEPCPTTGSIDEPHHWPDDLFPPGQHPRLNPHPDAALIVACEEYLRIEREFSAYYDTLPGDMEADDPGWVILDPIYALTEQIVALRATTRDGHFARARCMAFTYLPSHRVCQDDPEAAREDRLHAAMMRDLVHAERGVVA